MDKTAKPKTYLAAEFPTCSFPFLGAEASQGSLPKAWKEGSQAGRNRG